MPEHTKTPLAKMPLAALHLEGPSKNLDLVLQAVKSYGFTEIPQAVDDQEPALWRDAFPDLNEENLPGVCLRGAREKEGLTQIELSLKTGIPQRHISEMENGKRPIGKKNAWLFAKALNAGYKIFM